jgi:serine protease Do
MRRPVGVLIERLHDKGPGKQAGLAPGDVVVAVGRHDVDDVEALRFRIATRPVGGSVELTVFRKGETLKASFALVAPIEDPPRNITRLSGRNPFAGARVGNASPALAEELNFDSAASGVIVLDVAARSTAARLGFRPRDIIREVNGERVEHVEDLKRIAAQRFKRWRMVVRRNGQNIGFEVTE